MKRLDEIDMMYGKIGEGNKNEMKGCTLFVSIISTSSNYDIHSLLLNLYCFLMVKK